MQFIGDETEIDPANVKHPEFINWRWIQFDEIPQIAVPFKRLVYQAVVEEFADLVIPLKSPEPL